MAGSDNDGFSDEDLDALTAHDFYQLQENAIRSTQATAQATKAAAAAPSSFSKPADQASSDYGEIDDDLILNEDLDDQNEDAVEQPAPVATFVNQNVPGESTQREQWRQNRYATHQAPPANQHWNTFGSRPDLGISSKQVQKQGGQIEANQDVIMLDSSPKGDSPDVTALQAKIAELLSEKTTLQQAVKAANDNAFAKAGEVAIVRSKQEKLAREHNQQIATLQKANTDLAARQKVELEAARAEAEKIMTTNKYLEHDLQEEALQVRQLQKKGKAPKELPTASLEIRTRTKSAAPAKKKQVQDHGDGFDDDAFAPLSPSKSRQQKGVTPKAGEKRKRKAIDKSPGVPLRLTQPVRADSGAQDEMALNLPDDHQPGVSAHGDGAKPVVPSPQPAQKPDYRFEFTQKILNYRPGYQEKRYVDQLAKFAFKSDPETSLSSLFYQRLAALRVEQEEEFPASVASIFLALWAQCMDEKYYPPFSALITLIIHIIILSPLQTAPRLAETSSLVHLAQLTADINLIPRFRRTPNTSDDLTVDPTPCLELLLHTATFCLSFPASLTRFWRSMRFDFIYMATVAHQPFRDTRLMLHLLETSVMETSFAMVVPPGDDEQSASEAHVIDRISLLLVDQPKPAQDTARYTTVELGTLRLAALSLLDKASETDHGAEALARSPHAIGRLVRMINDELNRVYEYQAGHENSTELVNEGTLLLHYLMTTHKKIIDMGAKLSAVPGGKDKFMIAMTRLAFCEPVYFERGIEEAAVECAHELLDEMVDHREAREANEVFGRAG